MTPRNALRAIASLWDNLPLDWSSLQGLSIANAQLKDRDMSHHSSNSRHDSYADGFKAGALAMQQAAVQMLARAKQSAAALGVNLMPLPTQPPLKVMKAKR